MDGSYSRDELVELGCPPGLVIQYLFMSKAEINAMLYEEDMNNLINAMQG